MATKTDQPGNQTPDTPDVSETELRKQKVADLRVIAEQEGVPGAGDLHKDELVDAIVDVREGHGGAQESAREGGGSAGEPGDGGPDDGRVRTGPDSSKSLKYSQEITSPDDDPEREGRSLVTTSHEVIRQWAESRDGVPSTVEGTGPGDTLGVLRLDFGGDDGDRLTHVSWDEWFATFDERGLNFIYQEDHTDGRPSTFFRLENPDREDG
ncbi:Rho termination factor-like protein [Motilibacter rhizosphaerae]|uniref:Rho termination factor-like protein n=1 Tax=Motilibacter rhizosphaerae TaxID=598652 RepID=A0A4Q7NSU2_9ACTN|nr:Rho termination factor N-terminal domain-containing protein [Motilibacter rhizosphaerae]RZS90181.1 Rho termination factor-like protein [Motilibacter rhizosphaerae]